MGSIDTRYGVLSAPDGDGDIILEFLSRYGEWAWMEVSFIASLLKPGARVLDAGAFLGTFGLGLGGLVDLALLCCVEGNPAVFPLLQQNLQRQAKWPFLALNRVLAGPVPPARMWLAEPGNLGSTTFGTGIGAAGGDALPDPIGLDDLRREHGPFDLIKLDVEGMEAEVLASDAAHLSAGGTMLWLECNEDPRSLELGALLLSWRLPVYYFAFPSFNPANAKGERKAVFPWAYEAGLLVAPRIPPALTPELEAGRCFLVRIRSEQDLRRAMWRTPRWGRQEWEGAGSCSEMAALVGRALRDEKFEGFLQSDVTPVTIWQRLDEATSSRDDASDLLRSERARCSAAEMGLAEASTLAVQRLHALETAAAARDDALGTVHAERAKCEALEEGLAEASALAIQRLHDLDTAIASRDEALKIIYAERARSTALEAGLAEASALAVQRLHDLDTAIASRDEALRIIYAERARSTALEAGLAETSALAIERLQALEAATERLTAERKRLVVAEKDARDTVVELARASARALHARGLAGEVKDAADLREAAQKKAWCGEMDQQLRSMEEALEAELAMAHRAAEAAAQRAEHAELWLAAVKCSKSWRATRPIRGALRALKALASHAASEASGVRPR